MIMKTDVVLETHVEREIEKLMPALLFSGVLGTLVGFAGTLVVPSALGPMGLWVTACVVLFVIVPMLLIRHVARMRGLVEILGSRTRDAQDRVERMQAAVQALEARVTDYHMELVERADAQDREINKLKMIALGFTENGGTLKKKKKKEKKEK